MTHSQQQARKGDATLIVCQDNDSKTVRISSVNALACELFSLSEEALTERSLFSVLGAKTVETLQDFLEYEEDSGDLDEIIKRIREPKIICGGAETAVDLKIMREPSPDRNHWFRIILRSEDHKTEQMRLREMLHANLAGHQAVDEITGMADRDTALRALELTSSYIASRQMKACFAAIRIDRHNKNIAQYGEDACSLLLKHIAHACHRNFRTDDVLCRIGDNLIGVVLLDLEEDSARIVLNRLRWFISSHRIQFGGKSDFSVTISVAFSRVTDDRGDQVLQRCESELTTLSDDERNQLIDVRIR